ncbi:MAG: prepilin peptidase [Anaerosomatales bacterium]|nr:prepilin peptidase [Anaerosomatales bacterium]
MSDLPTWFFLLSLGLFGLIFGSLANVIVWRLPRGESLWSPGSHCPCCETPIRWFDNVPVISWLVLRGRCRSCGEPISGRYPLVEGLSGGLWVLAGALYGPTWRTVVAIALFYLLLVLTFIDLDHYRLPNPLVGLLATVGLVSAALTQLVGVELAPLVGVADVGAWSHPLLVALGGALAGGGLSLLIALAYGAVRGHAGFGMGDVKLLAALGPFLGLYTLMALVIGSFFGAGVGVATARGDAPLSQRRIPFGPFIALGAIVSVAIGPSLWGWYAHLVGLV